MISIEVLLAVVVHFVNKSLKEKEPFTTVPAAKTLAHPSDLSFLSTDSHTRLDGVSSYKWSKESVGLSVK